MNLIHGCHNVKWIPKLRPDNFHRGVLEVDASYNRSLSAYGHGGVNHPIILIQPRMCQPPATIHALPSGLLWFSVDWLCTACILLSKSHQVLAMLLSGKGDHPTLE